MTEPNRRLSERVPFRAPVLVIGLRGPLEAEIRDLSTTGIRFRLQHAIFAEPPQDLTGAAESLKGVIGTNPMVKLHHERLGPLVSRRARFTRVVLPADVAAVDVGCCFDRPLTYDESVMLGVVLLPEADAEPVALPRADTHAPSVRDAARVSAKLSRAQIHDGPRTPVRDSSPPRDARLADPTEPAADDATIGATFATHRRYRPLRLRTYVAGKGESIQCESEAIAPDAVVVRMGRSALSGTLATEVLEVGDAVATLAARFGETIRLRVADSGKHLWSGAARVTGVDLPEDRTDVVRVEFAFEMAMNPPERARFGL